MKLYDRVSAVIAELVSNSYDADATEVIVEAPMGQYLASKAEGVVTDRGREIRVIDDGIGHARQMRTIQTTTLSSARNDERYSRRGRGETSPKFGRKVMRAQGQLESLLLLGSVKSLRLSRPGSEVTRRTPAELH